MTDTGGHLPKAFIRPANEHDKWGGQALFAGMDLSFWPRLCKLFVDRGYRGLKGLASSLGLELAVVARPYAGVRGRLGAGGWVQALAQEVGAGANIAQTGAPPRAEARLLGPAWLGRNRRLAKDYEGNPWVSEAWVYLGMSCSGSLGLSEA